MSSALGVSTANQTHLLIRNWETVGEGLLTGAKRGYGKGLTNH